MAQVSTQTHDCRTARSIQPLETPRFRGGGRDQHLAGPGTTMRSVRNADSGPSKHRLFTSMTDSVRLARRLAETTRLPLDEGRRCSRRSPSATSRPCRANPATSAAAPGSLGAGAPVLTEALDLIVQHG